MSASAAQDDDILDEVLRVAGIACWTLDGCGEQLRVWNNFYRLLGHPDAAPADPRSYVFEQTHPDDRLLLAGLLATQPPSSSSPATLRMRQAQGLWLWLEVRSSQQTGDRRLLVFKDITRQRQVDAAARDSQLRYRALHNTAPLAFVLWDRQGHITEWNRRAEALFGWQASEVIGKRVHQLLLPEAQHEEFSGAMKVLAHDSHAGEFTGPALTRSGELRHCTWYSVALRTPTGQLSGILSLILDRTSEHQAQSHLIKSETTYRTLVETSPDAILLLALDGSLQRVNQQACELFGLDPFDDLQAVNIRQLIPADGQRDIHFLEHPEEFTGFIANRLLSMRHASGRNFDASTAFTCVADAQGKPGSLVLFVRDVSDKLQSERELEAHRHHLEELVATRTAEAAAALDSLAQIIDGSPVPTFVLDHEHVITHWNKACEEIIGIPASQMIGTRRQWEPFYPAQRSTLADLLIDGRHQDLLTAYGEHGRPSSVISDGYEVEDFFPQLGRWLFLTAAPLHDAQGRIIGAIETLQDTTRRKDDEAALREAKALAESAASAKMEFMANMSHEIRTPMNAVIGLAHLLQKTELSPRQRDYINRIHGAGQMLLQLINDILDFSKIEAGRMALEQVEFALDDVLDNVTSVVVHKAQEKGLEMHYVVDPDVPQRFIGDPLRLGQILINLLGNAIKFTARGGITVFLRYPRSDDRPAHLEVDVQDSGIGMSQEQQARLFQAFTQADTSITRKYGGSGLGLTICKRLVQLMGGDIWVRSQPGVGSTFSFEIALAGAGTGAKPPPGTNRRGLVVDDNLLARSVLVALLGQQGCVASAAESGEAALRLIDENPDIDFVTLDLNMPGMDGLEIASILRQRCPRRLRLVLVTASDTTQMANEGRLDDFDAILHKPLTAAQVARLFTPETTALPPEATPAPLAGMHALVVEDIPTNQLIAREMLESLGMTISVANNGREAVEEMARNGRRYDVVLMDIQMPEMDGLEATRRLRASSLPASLPIIAMTAHALSEERRRCQEAGMNGFITKPIDPGVLLRVLREFAPGRPGPLAAARPASSPAAGAPVDFPPLPGIDTADGLRRMMNKRALYEKVLHDFHARFANEADAIRQAIAAGDLSNAERRAHSSKGLAGTIGAKSLQAAALALEKAIREQAPVDSCLKEFSAALAEVIAGIGQAFPPPAGKN